MISFDKTEVMNFHNAMRGARNPLNSWNRMDSHISDEGDFVFGENDLGLAKRLINAGTDHRKFIRQIFISVDITAPLYWWKEFGPCKAETVVNSCSIIHQIVDRGIKLDDFSCENLTTEEFNNAYKSIDILNTYRWVYNNYEQIKKGEIPICKEIRPFINTMDKKEIERQMIQMLPSSYNWKRTLMLNYAVLMNIYISHKSHELNEWKDFCNWIEDLPYSELITGKEKNND